MTGARKSAGGLPLPANVDAERRVLGAVLQDGDLVLDAGLRPEDFFLEPHRHIWAAILAVHSDNMAIDVVTVGDRLHQGKVLEAVGGPLFLGDLMGEVGTTVGFEHHAGIVLEFARKRRLIAVATELATLGYDPEVSADDLQERAEEAIFGIAAEFGERQSNALTRLGPVFADIASDLEERNASELKPGIPTGLDQLDRITLGLHRTDLTIVAGRPGMGKTALGLGMAWEIARTKWVALFSLEMSAKQLALRLISSDLSLDLAQLRAGVPTMGMVQTVGRNVGRLSERQLYVDDTASVSLGHVRTVCRKLKMRGELDCMVLDYLTLMKLGPGDRNDVQIGANSKGLKALAKELDIPVVVLAQLNRKCESRTDKRPMLSDLQDSGSIEQDADNIIFVYRDEYYHPESEDRGVGEAIVAKQRNGPTDTARLAWLHKRAAYGNLSPGWGAP